MRGFSITTTMRAASGSSAENLFISLFEDVFGAERTGYLYSQSPFFDIYQDSRFADFLLENGGQRVAIEIDDDASHLPGHVSQVKRYDDLTKQNSMIHMGWAVYRWPVRIMQEQWERSQLIVDTWMEFVRDKRTVIFCASIRHAEQIVALLNGRGVPALAVSGGMKLAERNEATGHPALCPEEAAGAVRLRPAERGMGLPGNGSIVHGATYDVEGSVHSAAWAGHALGRRQGQPDGVRLRGQRQPIQHALFAA